MALKLALTCLLLLGWSLPSIAASNQPRPTYVVAVEADDVVSRVLFRAIEQEFPIHIVYRDYPSFDAILDSVEKGDSDFAANVTYTVDRAKRFDYSKPTNIEYTYLYSYSEIDLGELSTVGVPKDTIYAQLIEEHYPDINTVEYQGHNHAITLLESGEVDGVVDAINQLKPMLLAGLEAQLLNDYLSIKPVSIIRPTGKHERVLEKFVDFIHSEGVQKHLRRSISQYQFEIRRKALRKSVSQSDLKLYRPLRIKLDASYPYVQYKGNGEVVGISADILLQSCKILGIECDIVSDADETWESMNQDLEDKKIDVLAPITISEQRRSYVYFSEPYYYPESMVVKRLGYKEGAYHHVSELISERIGVVRDTIFDELLTRLLPQKPLHYFDDDEQLIDSLIDNKIDYAAMDSSALNSILSSSEMLPIIEAKSIGSFYRSDVAIGFAKNTLGSKLAPLFSRAITMLDTHEIINSYDKKPDWRTTLSLQKKFSNRAQALFIIVLSFMVAVAYFLYIQSQTDNLTGLKNRRALYAKYRRGIKAEQRLIYLDVNQFKVINDSFGHEAGDAVLKKLARIVMKYWDGNGYRIGGDEFILVGDGNEFVVQSMVRKLEHFYVTHSGNKYSISVAVGVSDISQDTQSLTEVLKQADHAMYTTKQESKQ
ncbi:transporter substrate-binding domain-containing protein [Vibrio tapetis subsp. quintayensis]|uniref:diguanylate cyclase n=1 Tax=Vibrio tapetis TaxID=52443 RepID=UPI0025B565EC|nr:transporter substrate-binding domain-containing protein [Vibrio tapetis]MDN3680436.1 transporter substrate-binding domain-containing protein [Vibrio tapetis subsp. quintayensis]